MRSEQPCSRPCAYTCKTVNPPVLTELRSQLRARPRWPHAGQQMVSHCHLEGERRASKPKSTASSPSAANIWRRRHCWESREHPRQTNKQLTARTEVPTHHSDRRKLQQRHNHNCAEQQEVWETDHCALTLTCHQQEQWCSHSYNYINYYELVSCYFMWKNWRIIDFFLSLITWHGGRGQNLTSPQIEADLAAAYKTHPNLLVKQQTV